MKKGKYPPYPGSNWDYAVRESARQMLQKPNRVICLYCRHQAVKPEDLKHEPDCPAKDENHDRNHRPVGGQG